jgi:hypothetical protein
MILIKSALQQKINASLRDFMEVYFTPLRFVKKLGDPYGIRTRVTAVKGRCLNRLTNGPTYWSNEDNSITGNRF